MTFLDDMAGKLKAIDEGSAAAADEDDGDGSRDAVSHLLAGRGWSRRGSEAKPALGLDLGASTIKAVWRAAAGVEQICVRAHQGRLKQTLLDLLAELETPPASVALTGSGGQSVAEQLGLRYVDPVVALLTGLGYVHGSSWRHIIDIGSGSASIVDLDHRGRFRAFRSNALCAAGTGSFLDEQAARLGIGQELRSSAATIANPPRVAARCAVFAKSDLIHHQQEGRSLPELWSGLCRGMVSSAISTLLGGRPPRGPVLFVGGVAQNSEVVRWLRKELGVEVQVPDDPQTFAARGASARARPLVAPVRWEDLGADESSAALPLRPPLTLRRSRPPRYHQGQEQRVGEIELRIHRPLAGDVVLGMDVGSTSTKVAVIDLEGRVLADLYRRTEGAPIAAAQAILAVLAAQRRSRRFRVRALGLTGSGRRLVGSVLGADVVVNEITAHVTATLHLDPDVEAIIEIGGQDAKFVRLRDGQPVDSKMSCLCAGGTGSFIEEQAHRLGLDVRDVGALVMDARPPLTTDRCTVFMEQDVDALIRRGHSVPEVLGAVLHSVAQNYLKWVAQPKDLGRGKICFMGATARNVGLVAAFEQQLEAPIVVSPWCHVMGALGVAQIALDERVRAERATAFVGLGIARKQVRLEQKRCERCANRCAITHARIDGLAAEESPSWGYLCGREAGDSRRGASAGFQAFQQRADLLAQADQASRPLPGGLRIGIPRALLSFEQLPLWRRFFSALGAAVVLSAPTDASTRAQARSHCGSGFCHPAHLAHGHVTSLLGDRDIDYVFVPQLHKALPHDDGGEQAVYCPYITTFGAIIKPIAAELGKAPRLLSPVVDLQWSPAQAGRHLARELGAALGADRPALRQAWREALAAQRDFEARSASLGQDLLSRLEAEGQLGIVLIGRSYHCFDTTLNLNLPRKLAGLGFTVLPQDVLPLEDVPVDQRFPNLFWKRGRRMVQAASFVAAHPQLRAVMLTSYACGPDAFLKGFVKKIMGDKPMLVLELDGHDADAGYLTRLEAFGAVIRPGGAGSNRPLAADAAETAWAADAEETAPGLPPSRGWARNPERLWIPLMHPYGSPFAAAALRRRGRLAQALPPETPETFALGKRLCGGGECLPAPVMLGSFLTVLASCDPAEPQSLFIPAASYGPCRYGQYQTLNRVLLAEAGYPRARVEGMRDAEGRDDPKLGRWFYDAAIVSDLLFRARCRLRPYDLDPPGFDRLMVTLIAETTTAIEVGVDPRRILADCARRLLARPREQRSRPLVGVVGELYLRYNVFTNNNLVDHLEAGGGEVWVEPLAPWFQYLAWEDAQRARERGAGVRERAGQAVKQLYMRRREHSLTKVMAPVLGDRPEPDLARVLNAGAEAFPKTYYGEPITTVGRAMEFARFGADLVINVAPFHCMSGVMTASIFSRLESRIGRPVVTYFCDGETDSSHLLRAHLAVLKDRAPVRGRQRAGYDAQAGRAA